MTTSREQLIERHIREYESRLKHIDELYERAQKATEHLPEEDSNVTELRRYAEQLNVMLDDSDDIKSMDVKKWQSETIKNAGPLGIWDILAQKLEEFIERHE